MSVKENIKGGERRRGDEMGVIEEEGMIKNK
jgi:hypothetical protein